MAIDGMTQTQERKISRMFALENEDAVQWFNQLNVFSELQDSRKLAALKRMDLQHFLRLCNDMEQAKLARRSEIEEADEKKQNIKKAKEYINSLGLSITDLANFQEIKAVKTATANNNKNNRYIARKELADDPASVTMRGKILSFYKSFYALSEPDGTFKISLQDARDMIGGYTSQEFSNYQNTLKIKGVMIGELRQGTAKILTLPQYVG